MRGAMGFGRGNADSRTTDEETWRTLAQLIRWRLVVGAGALIPGILLRPDVDAARRITLLGAALAVLAVVSGAYALLARWRRGATAQAWLQALGDIALITLLAAATGGQQSQFVLFYVLAVLWAGVVLETEGGLAAAVAASLGYLLQPSLGDALGAGGWTLGTSNPAGPVPFSPALLGFIISLGAAAGIFGGRARSARQSLALASREVERARLDTDRILESMSAGILTLDMTGTVLHSNHAAEQILGTNGQIRGRWCQDVFGDGQRALLERITETLESGRTVVREEALVRTREGREVPLGVTTSFLRDENGERRGAIAIFADLTEFKAVEERARRSETLAAIGQLSAGIAHEIRNCLNPISGSVEYLQRELALQGEAAHLFGLISKECERLNQFVTELLDYAREPDLCLETAPVAALVHEAFELVRHHPAYRPSVHLEFDAEEEGLWARVDREHFKRALVNLLQNALEALEGKGRIRVRLRAGGSDRVLIEISDTGPGIPAANLGRVTEPFFTTKRGGTGLGLAIATRIIERLGGRLRVYSPPGAGTTITLDLGRECPLAKAA